MANQLLGLENVATVRRLMANHPAIDFYVFVDSLPNLRLLQEAFADSHKPLNILLELGMVHGRTGMRDSVQALDLARKTNTAAAGVRLAGIAGYEAVGTGALTSKRQKADSLLEAVGTLAHSCLKHGLFDAREPVVISVGGSDFYDRCVDKLKPFMEELPAAQLVLRSGCYLTNDSGHYENAVSAMDERLAATARHLPPGEHALEVWAYVQSIPESGLALLNLGKRDISYDWAMPRLISWARPGDAAPRALASAHQIKALNDQHAYVDLPVDSPLQFGDMVGLGVSHPCTTFDKWRQLYVVDDTYRVIDAIRTWF